ncbi:bacillithiol biosynthesis deacetylase BshB1 [Texcoconibacillus texcoconensis]|uniref:Bacillithiol biosynthesis deacetylase BshB1 n=1 Tax=Texcoconibacillus texcoconensis TaxID=1095777 RepID=A0A840QQD4_9BACI|nr:bacillithiol biosynthesis deacetylase BshB1 [Texcoconibacillus texcoconensis]MBB5173575.1 bacillithiol biosynthesis deacetylase BshB1 [Texcoconibacillus texcoconensis]
MKATETINLLAFGAHPDDVEIGMGATLFLQKQKGYKTGICSLTLGEMSSNGTVEKRQEEAEKAANHLEVDKRIQLEIPDRHIHPYDDSQVRAVVEVIRRYQPQMIFAPFDKDRHPDHTACHALVKEAFFSAGVRKCYQDLGLQPFRPEALWFYPINGTFEPDVVVDISDVVNTKQRALEAYESQFFAEGESVKTPLNNGYLQSVSARDRLFGQQIGTTYGEGFVQNGPRKIKDLLGDKT